jgi:hypothetical protein
MAFFRAVAVAATPKELKSNNASVYRIVDVYSFQRGLLE